MTQEATFTLKCVGCGQVVKRPAVLCQEMPFCSVCYMPMTLEKVTIKNRKERKHHA